MSRDVATCNRLHWGRGTILEGDEGYGLTRIVLTYVGLTAVMAIWQARPDLEASTTLQCREWRQVGYTDDPFTYFLPERQL